MKRHLNLAAKKSVLAFFMASMLSLPAQAGIPVIDAANVVQTTVSALNSVAAVQKQIEQYTTQLKQYQNMLQNSLAPPAYIWDQASLTISKLLQAQDTLNYYKNQAGSLNAYLNRYQDVNYYRSSPCFNNTRTCTNSDLQALRKNDAENSEARKKANDAVLKVVDQQQDTLQSDAQNLVNLQSQASGAEGQMQAMQAANQLASAQANQLLQIRSILVAQNTAAATLAQAQADKEAKQAAAAEAFRAGSYSPSSSKSW